MKTEVKFSHYKKKWMDLRISKTETQEKLSGFLEDTTISSIHVSSSRSIWMVIWCVWLLKYDHELETLERAVKESCEGACAEIWDFHKLQVINCGTVGH